MIKKLLLLVINYCKNIFLIFILFFLQQKLITEADKIIIVIKHLIIMEI